MIFYAFVKKKMPKTPAPFMNALLSPRTSGTPYKPERAFDSESLQWWQQERSNKLDHFEQRRFSLRARVSSAKGPPLCELRWIFCKLVGQGCRQTAWEHRRTPFECCPQRGAHRVAVKCHRVRHVRQIIKVLHPAVGRIQSNHCFKIYQNHCFHGISPDFRLRKNQQLQELHFAGTANAWSPKPISLKLAGTTARSNFTET